MPAVMRILGWKAQGLRCPDHEISCVDSSGNPYPVSLIQMPNGTGKTTTLDLLRAGPVRVCDRSGLGPAYHIRVQKEKRRSTGRGLRGPPASQRQACDYRHGV